MENRVTKLEQDVKALEIRTAINESDIKNVKDDLNTIKSNTSRTLWGILAILVTAIINFLLGGAM